jgi:hypothetical protein
MPHKVVVISWRGPGSRPPDPPIPPDTAIPGARYVLDDFDVLRVVQPLEPNAMFKYLWKHTWYNSKQSVSVDSLVTFRGKPTLSAKWDSSGVTSEAVSEQNWQLYFYTYTLYAPEFPPEYNGFHFAHEFIEPQVYPPQVEFGKINRLRFWIKVPPGVVYFGDEVENFEFGTFHRSFPGNSGMQQEDGNHFYHFGNMKHRDGVWQQFIIDTHPQHKVGTTGIDPGDMIDLYPGSGRTYLEHMASWYLDFPYQKKHEYPWPDGTEFRVAAPEFYEETRPEDVLYVSSLNGSFQPLSNNVHLQWQHMLGDTTSKYDVRYSDKDIHVIGWNAATDAPNGQGLGTKEGGYRTMDYETTELVRSSSHKPDDILYLAVKKQGMETFRVFPMPVGNLDSLPLVHNWS